MQQGNEPGAAVAVVEQDGGALTVFGTSDPGAIVERVGGVALALGDFIRKHGMAKRLESPAAKARREQKGDPPPREYVMIDGWSFMGQMLGVASVVREVRELRGGDGRLVGFEATAELVTRSGAVVGGGIGECTRAEWKWEDRDDFALKSMAQTRAIGKAFRVNFGFIMGAAGFEATPMEEMVDERDDDEPRTPRPPVARAEGLGGKQNGVAWPERIDSVVTLFQAARYAVNWQPPQVAEALGGKVPGDVAGIVQRAHEGNYVKAFDVVCFAAGKAGVPITLPGFQEPQDEAVGAAPPEPARVPAEAAP